MEGYETETLDDVQKVAKLFLDDRFRKFYVIKPPRWVDKLSGQLSIGRHLWYDHVRFVRQEHGGVVMMCQPYNFSIDMARDLITFCDKNKMDFIIDGMSPHSPLDTVAITISPLKKHPW